MKVLQCLVTEIDDRDALRWSELMMEVVCMSIATVTYDLWLQCSSVKRPRWGIRSGSSTNPIQR
jgi:hypothetical protein